jgi:hypothetical protein
VGRTRPIRSTQVAPLPRKSWIFSYICRVRVKKKSNPHGSSRSAGILFKKETGILPACPNPPIMLKFENPKIPLILTQPSISLKLSRFPLPQNPLLPLSPQLRPHVHALQHHPIRLLRHLQVLIRCCLRRIRQIQRLPRLQGPVHPALLLPPQAAFLALQLGRGPPTEFCFSTAMAWMSSTAVIGGDRSARGMTPKAKIVMLFAVSGIDL